MGAPRSGEIDPCQCRTGADAVVYSIRRVSVPPKWRGCDWSGGGLYSYRGDATGPAVGYIPIEGLRLVRRR
eukprot:1192515-Prorocentrum_minimum.AAC.1